MTEEEREERRINNAYMKIRLKGLPIGCDKCGKNTAMKYFGEDGVVKGITLRKINDKYYCQYC